MYSLNKRVINLQLNCNHKSTKKLIPCPIPIKEIVNFIHLPQFRSSLPSKQSLTLLHLEDIGTHCPFEHVNCAAEHPIIHNIQEIFS